MALLHDLSVDRNSNGGIPPTAPQMVLQEHLNSETREAGQAYIMPHSAAFPYGNCVFLPCKLTYSHKDGQYPSDIIAT